MFIAYSIFPALKARVSCYASGLFRKLIQVLIRRWCRRSEQFFRFFQVSSLKMNDWISESAVQPGRLDRLPLWEWTGYRQSIINQRRLWAPGFIGAGGVDRHVHVHVHCIHYIHVHCTLYMHLASLAVWMGRKHLRSVYHCTQSSKVVLQGMMRSKLWWQAWLQIPVAR